jgi:hypothetical protein
MCTILCSDRHFSFFRPSHLSHGQADKSSSSIHSNACCTVHSQLSGEGKLFICLYMSHICIVQWQSLQRQVNSSSTYTQARLVASLSCYHFCSLTKLQVCLWPSALSSFLHIPRLCIELAVAPSCSVAAIATVFDKLIVSPCGVVGAFSKCKLVSERYSQRPDPHAASLCTDTPLHHSRGV